MTNKKWIVYVSHPIKGMSEAMKSNTEERATKWAAEHAAIALLPRLIPPWCEMEDRDKCVPDGSAGVGAAHTHACYMRGDLIEMLGCDAILLMPGWEESRGCRDELNAALSAGLPILFYSIVA